MLSNSITIAIKMMIDKNWKYGTDGDGNFCIYYKNPTTGEWDLFKMVKKPKFKKNGSMKKSRKSCAVQ